MSTSTGAGQYIDSSVRILTTGMKSYWGGSRAFPGPLPAGPFQAFFRDHEVDLSHYYSAYPDATVTTIRGALDKRARLIDFVVRAQDMSSEQRREAFLEEFGSR